VTPISLPVLGAGCRPAQPSSKSVTEMARETEDIARIKQLVEEWHAENQ